MNVSLRDIKKDINSSEDILVFFRKNKLGGKFYRKLITKHISREFKINSFTTISEYKGSGDVYIDLKKISLNDIDIEDYNIINKVIDIDDVMIRERCFRSAYDYYEARDLIIKCSKYFLDLFKGKKWKLIIGQPVDNYVMDIMTRIAKYYGLYYYGICKFIYNDYVRITTKGEINKIRNIEIKEAIELRKRLSNFEKNIFDNKKVKIYKDTFINYIKYKIKLLYQYYFLHKILGKLEYDYMSTKVQVHTKSLINCIRSIKLFNKYIPIKNKKNRKVIYIPLHYFPEGTTEYWIHDKKKCTYYPELYYVIKLLSQHGFEVYIKEHPAQYLKRDFKYLYKLAEIKNVTILSPFITPKKIIDTINNVLIWNGTTGLEFLAHRKNVYKACEGFYTDKIPDIHELIKNGNKTSDWTEDEVNELFLEVLSGTIRGE